MDGLRHRLHVWLHRDAYAREQAEERRFHREMEAMHGRPGRRRPDHPRSGPGSGSAPGSSGLSSPPPFDPRPERTMGSRLLDALRQDLGYALRGLVRSPGFTALAVLTLALGVGANGAVFSVLDRMFGQPPAGLEEPEGLRRLYVQLPEHPMDPGMVFPWFNYPAFSAMDEAVTGGSDVAAWTPSSEATVRDGDRELTVRRTYVTHDYFGVLGVGAARGRLFGPDEARVDVPAPVAVLSHDLWERAFASDPEVLGRTLKVDSVVFTVVGVASEGFRGLDLSYSDLFLPLSTFPAQGQLGLPWYEWIGNYLHAVARLQEGVDEAVLAEQATAGYQGQVLPRGQAPDPTAAVVPGSIIAARGVGAQAGTPHANQAVSLTLRMAGVSAIVLLIAGANVAGLLLVRASRRRREIAVRRALGVSRRRLASQLLTEGLVLATLSAAAAVLLAGWGGGLLRRLLLPDVEWARAALDLRTVVFALASAAAVGLFAALAPALQSWRTDVGAGLKAGPREGGSGRPALRSGLLAGQAALAVVLLVGAGLFVRSLENVAALRLGFDVEELAWVSLGDAPGSDEPGVRAEVASRLAALGGVSSAALARVPPMQGASMTRVFLPGRDSLPDLGPAGSPAYNTVSPEFFRATGMRILEGRAFAAGEENVLVVSETMARTFWPGRSAVGQCLILGEPDGPCQTVVGVAEDSRRMRILEEQPALNYFRPRPADTAGGVILLRVDPRRWSAVAASVREELDRRFGPGEASLRSMTEALDPQLRPWRLGARLFTAFGGLALLVTVVGVYSVMAYAVSQRTHEMGVRMALGARLRDVMRLVLGQGLRVVAVGAVLGVVVALGLGRLVESLLYDVTPRDPVALAGAAAVLLATGAVACLVPAWRAGRVDPAETLREE